MKRRLLITALLTLACVFLLCVVASAETYYVNDSAEAGTYTTVASAFSVATDGDTIVIQKNVTDPFNFTKAITYKLEGVEWQCVAGSVADASRKTISVFAIGNGDSRFIPNGGCWINNAGTLGTLHWQFGGESENARLIFDFSGCNRRLLYPSNNITMSFLPYSDITNYSGNVSDGTNDKAIRVKELNVYDNVCIYGNKTMSGSAYFVPFIDATTYNMYGGKIFGNASDCSRNGYITVTNFNMYGGEIFNNYLCSSNVGSLINCSGGANVYDGKIYDNHVVGNGGNMDYAVFSAYSTYKTSYYKENDVTGNILYPSGTSFTLEECTIEVDGRRVSAYTVDVSDLTPKETYSVAYRTQSYSYSVLFKNSDGSVVDAFMIKEDGGVLKSVSGASEISVPADKSWAIKAYYCEIVTPVTDAQGTYYVAAAHTFAGDDFNCETGDSCTVCPYKEEALSHVIAESLKYENGFVAAGVYVYECTNEGCSACDVSYEVGAIFTCRGYTKTEVGALAIMQSFAINREALAKYNLLNENDIVGYGLVAGSVTRLGDNAEIFENGAVSESTKALTAGFESKEYDIMEIKITGLGGATGTEHTAVELYCCGYFITADKESTYITVNEGNKSCATAVLENSISFEKIQ